MENDLKKLILCLKWDVDNIEDLNIKRAYLSNRVADIQDQVKNCALGSVIKNEVPLSINEFRVGFEYEELEMDSERYLNKGLIWKRKTYGLDSPRLHKMQRLIEQGKVRRA